MAQIWLNIYIFPVLGIDSKPKKTDNLKIPFFHVILVWLQCVTLGKWSNFTIFQIGLKPPSSFFVFNKFFCGLTYCFCHVVSCHDMEPNWRDMEPNWRRQDWAAGPFFQEDLTSNEVESLEMSGDPRWIFLWIHRFLLWMKLEKYSSEPYLSYLGWSPFPVIVTTRIFTFLVGNSYKPSFLLLLGRGTTQIIPYWWVRSSKIVASI